ncbi:MAG: putative Ig domain-containing protein, partial [Flavobacteriales bacterium]|nr:putative Ig domain-containing protein [Flavobacteriales bacterium]
MHKHGLTFFGDWYAKKYDLYELTNDGIKLSITADTFHNPLYAFHIPHQDPCSVRVHQNSNGIGAEYKSCSLLSAPFIDGGGLDSYSGYTDNLTFNFTNAQTGEPQSVRITSIAFKLFEPILDINEAFVYAADSEQLIHVKGDQVGHELNYVYFASWGQDRHVAGSWNLDTSIVTSQLLIQPADYASFRIYSITVEAYDVLEVTSTPVTQATENESYQYAISTTADDETLTYSFDAAPEGMTIDAETGLINWIPNHEQAGSYSVVVNISDSQGVNVEHSYSITVANNNRAPEFVSDAITTAKENTEYHYEVIAIDEDDDVITYQLITAPEGMTIDDETRTITWLPGYDAAGTHPVVIQLSDVIDSTTQSFDVVVENTNRAPILSPIGDQILVESQPLSITLQTSDADNDTLTYSVFGLPNFAIHTNTQIIFSPGFDAAGNYGPITVMVSDGTDNDEFDFSIAVTNKNQTPEITSAAVTVGEEGGNYQYAVIAIDADEETLTYQLTTAPAGMTINATGIISWTPDFDQSGDHAVELSATDGTAAVTQSYTIAVANTNRAPVLTAITDQTVAENQSISVTLQATDVDEDPLTFSVIGLPAFASLDGSQIIVAPGFENAGSYGGITVTVSDGVDSQQTTFSINVTNVNRVPEISSTAVTAGAEGDIYQYTVIAADADDETLIYQLTTAPAGMTINATGIISWTPNFDQSGDHAVAVSASDGTAAVTQSYTIAVTNTNRAPVLTAIADQTVAENQSISITLQATDADEDTLTFSVSGLPNFASQDGSQIIVAPSFENSGSYGPVTVTVSDGVDSQQITFSINVTNVNRVPEISSTAVTVGAEGDSYQYAVIAT